MTFPCTAAQLARNYQDYRDADEFRTDAACVILGATAAFIILGGIVVLLEVQTIWLMAAFAAAIAIGGLLGIPAIITLLIARKREGLGLRPLLSRIVSNPRP